MDKNGALAANRGVGTRNIGFWVIIHHLRIKTMKVM